MPDIPKIENNVIYLNFDNKNQQKQIENKPQKTHAEILTLKNANLKKDTVEFSFPDSSDFAIYEYEDIQNNGRYEMSGIDGKYGYEVQNASVRYGRNSVDNHRKYLKQLANPAMGCFLIEPRQNTKSFLSKVSQFFKNIPNTLLKYTALAPSIYFERQYMKNVPQNNNDIDKMSLLADAYEEMGRVSMRTSELTDQFNKMAKVVDVSAEALDINKNGRVDIAEYSAGILLADSFDDPDGKIDGKLTNKGESLFLAFNDKHDQKYAHSIYQQIYSFYGLEKAKEEFLNNPNNMSKD